MGLADAGSQDFLVDQQRGMAVFAGTAVDGENVHD
jgi:hypothetical protein